MLLPEGQYTLVGNGAMNFSIGLKYKDWGEPLEGGGGANFS